MANTTKASHIGRYRHGKLFDDLVKSNPKAPFLIRYSINFPKRYGYAEMNADYAL